MNYSFNINFNSSNTFFLLTIIILYVISNFPHLSFFLPHSDPNKGESSVPVTWPEFAGSGHKYLDINNKMNGDSVKQMLRTRLVYYWTTVFASFPAVQKN